MTNPILLCPACSAPLLPGPRGGAAQNYYCTDRADCRQGFNLTIRDGLVLFEQAIGEVDDQRFEMYFNQQGATNNGDDKARG